MQKTITLRLSIEVSYEPNGVETSELEAMLTDIANHAAGEGMFTGSTAAEVTSWHPHVEATHVGHSSKRK